jgi:protocatechuate 3,4-dioxygenase, beta subunit
MKHCTIFLIVITILLQQTGCAQKNAKELNTGFSSPQKVGGSCEGCEVIHNSPIPFEKLSWIDTLPDYNEPGPKLVVSGIVYKPDGKTPAKDIVLYVYHTDQSGKYTNRNNEKGYAGKNGYIKGWIKTNAKGEYKFYTLKPAPYPGSNIPAHIHPVIKEPGINEYYIDEYLFEDDPFLTRAEKNRQEKRGGNGIIRTTTEGTVFYASRDIYLGRNIPNHPGNGDHAAKK